MTALKENMLQEQTRLRLLMESQELKISNQKQIIKKMRGLIEMQRVHMEMKCERKFLIKPLPKIVVEDTSKLRLVRSIK